MRRYLAALFLAGLILAQDGGKEIPTFPGDDNPQHNGQPEFCIGASDGTHKPNCGVCNMCGKDAPESPKCKTYCRRGACRFHESCKVTHMQMPEDGKRASNLDTKGNQ